MTNLRQDPYALETAYLSVITFDESETVSSSNRTFPSFQAPAINASGSTALGGALSLLAERIEAEVAKTTAEEKGDWKPLVFIMTDGGPTDDWRKGLDALNKVKKAQFVACAAGPVNADITAVLKQITEVVVSLDTTDDATIKAFFKWVSASVSVGSQKVEQGQKEVIGLKDLPAPPPEVNVVLLRSCHGCIFKERASS